MTVQLGALVMLAIALAALCGLVLREVMRIQDAAARLQQTMDRGLEEIEELKAPLRGTEMQLDVLRSRFLTPRTWRPKREHVVFDKCDQVTSWCVRCGTLLRGTAEDGHLVEVSAPIDQFAARECRHNERAPLEISPRYSSPPKAESEPETEPA